MNWKDLGKYIQVKPDSERISLMSLFTDKDSNKRLQGFDDAFCLDRPVRILVKTSIFTELSWANIQVKELLFGKERGIQNPVIGVKAAGLVINKKYRWNVIELPLSLGAFLKKIEYNNKIIDGLMKELKSQNFITPEFVLPQLNYVMPLQENNPECTVGRDQAPEDVEWAVNIIGMPSMPDVSFPKGDGIKIGQIDTGYTKHVELNYEETYDLDAATSFIDEDNGIDSTQVASHGTAAASVICSHKDYIQLKNDFDQDSFGITGVAPGATIVCVRAIEVVVVFFNDNLLPALQYCVETHGCQVVTMSFGGFITPSLRENIKAAYEANVLLIAAAGNCVGGVVLPARMPEVIACAACGIDEQSGQVHPWRGSSFGSSVDITAPGENVWVADWKNNQPIIRPGEGTSYATPHVAAAAALWLEVHGRSLRSRLTDQIKMCDLFRDALRQTATIPYEWDTNNYGAGVLNLAGLISDEGEVIVGDHTGNPNFNESAVGHLGEVFGALDDIATHLGTLIGGAGVASIPSSIMDGIMDKLNDLDVNEAKKVTIDMQYLDVRDDGEFLGGAEPYLLQNIFVVDGELTKAVIEVEASTLGIESFHIKLKSTTENSGFVKVINLGRKKNIETVDAAPWSDKKRVPETGSLSINSQDLIPIPIQLSVKFAGTTIIQDIAGVGFPGFIGVNNLLFESDFTPEEAILAGQMVAGLGVSKIINRVISDLTQDDLSINMEDFLAETRDVEDAVKAEVIAKTDWWKWILAWDRDDLLINTFNMYNYLQLTSPQSIQAEYKGAEGDWVLVGEVRQGN